LGLQGNHSFRSARFASVDTMSHSIQIPGYKIIRQIGSGGMATVYLAVQEALDRQVALKIMSQQIVGQQDSEFRERFSLEGRSIAQLSHNRIVSVFDMGMQGDNYYIAMEYLSGGSLKEKIQQGLAPHQAIEIAKKIADSLGYAHKKGFVHRDVKPMNIMFREDGEPILTDFGIAKIVVNQDANLTATGLIMGTPSYMSPEQAQGQTADGRADLYSLGVMLYEMLMGVVPFRADTAIALLMKHVNDPRPDLPTHLTQYQYLLDGLLEKNPDNRYQSAEDFIRATEVDDLDEQTVVHVEGVEKTSALKQRRGSPLKAIFISLSILLIGVGGYFASLHYFPFSEINVPIPVVQQERNQVDERWLTKKPDIPVIEIKDSTVEFVIDDSAPELEQEPSVEAVETIETIRRDRIAALLVEAKLQLTQQQYIQPAENNALDTYRKILSIDANSDAAQRGINLVVSHLEEKAVDMLEQNEINRGLELIESGLLIKPGKESLRQLKKSVEASIAMKKSVPEPIPVLAPKSNIFDSPVKKSPAKRKGPDIIFSVGE
jgi:serine/threonine protein kinase